uniref:RNA-directed RNA polymerase C-terminal domain-containing protein n=1 Tax=Riboviria sp. TaxID=2585031 RepID=A0A8K1U2Q7_9VIRU|nr:MAG: hypothetical protein [Riboviria sp.]
MILEAMRLDYLRSEWTIPEDFLRFSHFERVVDQLDMSSSPGYPYMTQYSSNALFFGVVDGVKDEGRKWSIFKMVTEQLQARVSDPIRLFIKPEPHKQTKIDNRAYRLISSVSVVDQIIDHMLFDDFNLKIQDNHIYQVPQVGWAPVKQGWMHVPTTGVAMDKSGWDWTVLPWILEMILELRIALCVNMTEEWKDLASWRYQQLFQQPLFVTSGGHLLKQKQPGVMKSGCVNTISDNSMAQDLLDKVVECRTGIHSDWMMTMGDDTYQSVPSDIKLYVAELSKYCKVKDVVFAAEFAGFRFDLNWIEPLYTAKHCYTLLHLEDSLAEETAAAYALLYHRSRKGKTIKRIAAEVTQLPSDAWLDEVWDGED